MLKQNPCLIKLGQVLFFLETKNHTSLHQTMSCVSTVSLPSVSGFYPPPDHDGIRIFSDWKYMAIANTWTPYTWDLCKFSLGNVCMCVQRGINFFKKKLLQPLPTWHFWVFGCLFPFWKLISWYKFSNYVKPLFLKLYRCVSFNLLCKFYPKCFFHTFQALQTELLCFAVEQSNTALVVAPVL